MAANVAGTNPLAGNELRSREDLQRALLDLYAPLTERFSPAGARVRLGLTAAHFSQAAAELEGFARPLWGLVPLVAGDGTVDLTTYRRGLASGSDPNHPEFWGRPGPGDSRLVEMAAIGLGLAMTPEHVWDPLDASARTHLARWLGLINEVELPVNNWMFFRVLVNLGLRRTGSAYDPEAMHAALGRLETCYLGAGWYSDGLTARRDYYVSFAMHFYGLIYATLAGQDDPARAERFRERAATFARDFARWFAPDGSALPFGRSLTYRFAQGAFWGALAFADVEALPWGQVKGLALRHLRWWSRQPIADATGVLSVGYAYPNLTMSEDYNSPGSPYWAFKFFLPLAVSPSHPFWQAEEERPPADAAVHDQGHAGMVVCRHHDGHVVALSGGQHASWVRHGAEKYAKFAYSTAFAFSVPAARRGLEQGAHDSMLALSDDGSTHWTVREEPEQAAILDGHVLYSRWRPWPDVEVETWLVPSLPWHVRLHRLRTGRTLASAEGGFAVSRDGDDHPDRPGEERAGDGWALAAYPGGVSGVRDLDGRRVGLVVRAYPNTNLLAPRTALPTLLAEHAPGEHWLLCAVLGLPDPHGWEEFWNSPPEQVLHDIVRRPVKEEFR
ncbi:MAG: DUF2264 domain-containing protein [Jiangellaceae bacterium]